MSQFSEGLFDEAINTFIELDINPAKVVALYPESIAGRLSVPKEKWFSLHGGHPPREPKGFETSPTASLETSTVAVVEGQDHAETQSLLHGSLRGRWKVGLDRLVPGMAQKDDDTASVSAKAKEKPGGGPHLRSFSYPFF